MVEHRVMALDEHKRFTALLMIEFSKEECGAFPVRAHFMTLFEWFKTMDNNLQVHIAHNEEIHLIANDIPMNTFTHLFKVKTDITQKVVKKIKIYCQLITEVELNNIKWDSRVIGYLQSK
eukprot:13890734-Ditylum_brightwellii.AAC.1